MIQKYILELLHQHNCVILPNFGGFITRYISADIHTITNKITPPSKEIAFNDKLTSDDGLLLNHLAHQESISLESASKLVGDFVIQIQEELNNYKITIIEGIGKLFYNEVDKLDFLPELTSNVLEDSFGLKEFFLKPLETNISNMDKIPPKSSRQPIRRRPPLKQEETKVKKLQKLDKVDGEGSSDSNNKVLKYSILGLVLLLLLFGSGYMFFFQKNNNYLANIFPSNSKIKATATVSEINNIDNKDLISATSVESENITKKVSDSKFYIIVGSFQNEQNAQNLIKKYSTNNNLSIIQPNEGENTFRVSVAEYGSKSSARAQLANYKKQFGGGVWVLTK
ncbi:MAG: SPOR domain-containing protein [Cytophagales bacterium]|nr:MAG: SPOR domain-containing protein [Cytophagales bacterium]